MTEQNEKKLNVKSFELDHRLVSAPYIRVADRTDLGGGVVESAHIIPAYAVKNLFQEVTLSRDYTGEV